MKRKTYFLAMILALTGCGSENYNKTNAAYGPGLLEQKEDSSMQKRAEEQTTKAFFGDISRNRVVVVDVENMKLNEPKYEAATGHLITYTADKVYDHPKLYVVNRGSNAIDVMSTKSMEIIKTIDLEHFPRSSERMNKRLRLNQTSGMDKPMSSIIDIDKDELILSVGKDKKVDTENNPNFGGSHATGHPFWLDKDHFVTLDRYNRKIHTYKIEKNVDDEWVSHKINEINTTSSIHQIIPSKGRYLGEKGLFYGTAEGAPDIYPSIIEFRFDAKKGLVKTREVELKKDGVEANDTWLHHGDFHPTKKLIYVGAGDGTLYIVDYEKMRIVKTIKAGKGAGHTVMIPKKNMAIVINHKDTFVTIVDIKSNTKVSDVTVSSHDEWSGNKMIQAHPKYHISKDSKYFYAFLTEEGTIYEMNLDRLRVVRRLEVGGKPTQGSFVTSYKSQ